MDTTDRLARVCPLSRWKGDPELCRWDNQKITGRNTVFHTKRCARLWGQHHFYRKARIEARKRARGPCPCPKVRSHILCRHCGICEGQTKLTGFVMECNHIVARNGDKRSVSCMHHQDNLEMLCHACHLVVSRQQRLDRRTSRDRG